MKQMSCAANDHRIFEGRNKWLNFRVPTIFTLMSVTRILKPRKSKSKLGQSHNFQQYNYVNILFIKKKPSPITFLLGIPKFIQAYLSFATNK